MRARHWLDCPPSLTHGNLVQRVIFCKAEAASPAAGAVLRHVDRFARACLEPGASSLADVHEGQQEVFFVASGAGTLVTSGREREVEPGDGILVPPGVEHRFRNHGPDPLELLVIEETLPRGMAARRSSALVRNYRESALSQGHWHHLVHHLFGPDDGLGQLSAVLVVRMEPMTTSEPHGHDAGTDEVWYMWKGCGVHVVDRDVRVQRPGMAIQVAPSAPGHALTNHTEEPLEAFYFAHAQ